MENLKANQIKEKYLSRVVEEMYNQMYSFELDFQRIKLGNEGKSEEEIIELAKESIKEYVAKEEDYADLYDINKRSLHKVEVLGQDIESLCDDLRGTEKFTFRVLLFDDNKYLGYKEVVGTTLIYVDVEKLNNMINSLSGNDCKKVVTVRYIPGRVACPYSKKGGTIALKDRIILAKKGIELFDDCLMTEMDFSSRVESEKEYDDCHVMDIPIDKDSLEKIKDTNICVERCLKLPDVEGVFNEDNDS